MEVRWTGMLAGTEGSRREETPDILEEEATGMQMWDQAQERTQADFQNYPLSTWVAGGPYSGAKRRKTVGHEAMFLPFTFLCYTYFISKTS